MNAGAWLLLCLAAVAAVGDWFAVARRNQRLEYVCKPLTMVFLLGLAGAIDVDVSSVRTWFLIALALSLLGDVFLMLPRDAFIPGLVSFLLAHLAFIVGMWVDGVGFLAFALGLTVAAIAVVIVGGRILRAVRGGEHAEMTVPVGVYMAVISLMLASAIGTEELLAIVGASLFFCSDALDRLAAVREGPRLAPPRNHRDVSRRAGLPRPLVAHLTR